MVCILSMEAGKITGWLIAVDIDDARRRAQAGLQRELAAELYRMTFMPQPGRYELMGGRYLMLVD